MDQPAESNTPSTHKTACILCSINCGIEVTANAGHLVKIRGDRQQPISQGYTCEKTLRLDHYQNARGRLSSPLRRRADGGFDEISWDTAINEIAERLASVRDRFGGESILYYGGGGQGNHLGGAYSRATRAALKSTFASNALAQEKTGEFWVDGQLFGSTSCHTAGDFEHAEVAVFVGKNPWQSHGIPRARVILKEIAADPNRCLIVIDPRRTETAKLADIHLQVKPGKDVYCLTAILGVLFQQHLVDEKYLVEHCVGAEALTKLFETVDPRDYAQKAGLRFEQIETVAKRIAAAKSVSMFEDLGIQQAPQSTLNSYLEKLIYLVTGNFGKKGGMNLHTALAPLIGRDKARVTPVGKHRVIAGMIPCNVIPEEILTDHPKRFRAMFVESANPAHSLADSPKMRQALQSLDTLVVIDVAMTETARLAHYVLPAASQFEKWEATFFNLEFPKNHFQLRAPIFDAKPGTLAEPEIHRRLVRALGVIKDDDLTTLKDAAAQIPTNGRAFFAQAFLMWTAMRPDLAPYAPVVLYEVLGPYLPTGAAATAVLWAASHLCAMTYRESVQRAGFSGDGAELGENLFEAILTNRSGVIFSVDPYEVSWSRLKNKDHKINLVVQELLDEWHALRAESTKPEDGEFPFVLSAGERRSSTANTIFRDPKWRNKDAQGALRICPEDAQKLGLQDGSKAKLTTRRGSVEVVVEVNDTLQSGHITLPNGLGVDYPDENGISARHGVPPNELTCVECRDWVAGTPWHKHVPAKLEALG